ncbi:MAG: hypothetical protein Tp176DCM1853251_29 [Prokaryotic dsDNA virus sp.]|jgi:septal ring factor EnvC (AmiA/AmiB activator)|nr:MAG: hypothetical protein Tp176DCM1853251_29 [Prokaryotic dsDNA virus sp.]|tara:strand:- start:2987 stop:3334 length:348 start_codon:yes stop_codon:yes gene_type:complete
MTDEIEIRLDGSILRNSLQIGTATFTVPFPSEFCGVWTSSEWGVDFQEQIDEMDAAAEEAEERAKEAEEKLKEIESEKDEAESALESLRDEVRAFLAGNDVSSDALWRLKEALGE